jgi:hypothetical protein
MPLLILKYIKATFSVITVFLCFCMFEFALAQAEPSLDEVLNGFEDSQKKQDDSLQDIMDGFEDGGQRKEGDEESSEDDVLQGFEEEQEDKPQAVAEKEYLPHWISLDGYLKLGSSYNLYSHTATGTDTNLGGLSRLRAELELELDAKLSDSWQARLSAYGFYDLAYTINGRDDYTRQVLNNYESEVDLGESWIWGSLTKDLDLKAGRQIVVWGKSDNIRITDVLNPLDFREPGLTDLTKIRLPVAMTKLDYYIKGLNLSGIVVHEIRYNKNPVFGSDFFPAPQPLPSTEDPDTGLTIDDMQFGLALQGIFRGWDASLYGAYYFDQTPHLAVRSMGLPPTFKQKHARLKMVGAAFNIATGNWLFKTEAAYLDGIRFLNGGGKDYNRTDVLVGLEYSGFTDTTVSFEIADRHINNYDSRLDDGPNFEEQDRFVSAIRVTRTFLNETLKLTVLAQTFGVTGDDGAFQRLTAEYDLTDSVELTGGVVFYQSGDLPRFKDVGSNDRVYLEMKYHF